MIKWLRNLFKRKTYVVPPFYPYKRKRLILKKHRKQHEINQQFQPKQDQ